MTYFYLKTQGKNAVDVGRGETYESKITKAPEIVILRCLISYARGDLNAQPTD
jgi:hypothetical protein